MRIKKSLIISVVSIMAIFVGGWIFLKGKLAGPQESVKIISPHYGTIQTIITTTATVLPKNRLGIKPPVNGRVEQVLVKEGDTVKTGQILAWMSSTDRAALLDAARGQGEDEYKKWVDVYKPIPLLAPIDGEVIVATTQPGQTVTSVDDVIVLSDHLIVRAQVDETDIGKVKLNQAAVVSLDAYPDVKIKTRVDHIYYESTTVNNVTIYNVDLLPEKIPAFFRSGMNSNVDFIVENKEHILLLPISAVTRKDEQSFVYVQSSESNKTVKKEIQTGITDDKNIEIISGINEEDNVVVKLKKFSLNKTKTGSNPFMASGRPAGGGR
ncbi:MAG: efflux RND transporter periplasmic adaptor subunit [Candidatus Omnitrophica bacterium]|nr:efflux RND transporter periplasmic adaptor subunit [Candidatus Omnitrophota bacterium]